METCQAAYRHTLAVRWGECDQQGIVFNAHYLAYIDDALETWLRPIRPLGDELGWDMKLVKCTIEWYASLRSGDRVDIEVAVARWGGSSWDLGFAGSCEGRPVFGAVVVYVSVDTGDGSSRVTPDPIREFMGEAVDLVGTRRP